MPKAITFDQFRAANAARCLKWHPHGIESWSDSDWLVAIMGELGDTEPEGMVTRPNVRRCTMGVGCDEVGQCYASAHGELDRCGVPAPLPVRCPWDQWKPARDL